MNDALLSHGRTTPRLIKGERGVTSFPRWKTTHRLVLQLEDEATPRSRAGRHTVLPGSRRSAYQYPIGPVCTARTKS
ncbi:hypothetical protein GW17_00005011 [Ensete ventricosum]|nr:hypothetical protein GW17_00005011 [Ensete ventricosum]